MRMSKGGMSVQDNFSKIEIKFHRFTVKWPNNIGFIFKDWSKFKKKKNQAYEGSLSDNLYFKNRDNNADVFHTLIDAAEDENFIEPILAYSYFQ